jgi:hypothetical protein
VWASATSCGSSRRGAQTSGAAPFLPSGLASPWWFLGRCGPGSRCGALLIPISRAVPWPLVLNQHLLQHQWTELHLQQEPCEATRQTGKQIKKGKVDKHDQINNYYLRAPMIFIALSISKQK